LLRTTRQKYPKWGPRKILAIIARNHPALTLPSHSTVSELFRKEGLVYPGGRRNRIVRHGSVFANCTQPNDVWCADFKGWFRTADGDKCEPLTITDT
jgi:putative transposase